MNVRHHMVYLPKIFLMIKYTHSFFFFMWRNKEIRETMAFYIYTAWYAAYFLKIKGHGFFRKKKNEC